MRQVFRLAMPKALSVPPSATQAMPVVDPVRVREVLNVVNLKATMGDNRDCARWPSAPEDERGERQQEYPDPPLLPH